MINLVISGAQPSIWVWLAPVLTFCGSALLFGGALITVWRTNLAAFNRQTRELAAKERESNEDRAAVRIDQLRAEVAAILAERPATLDSQRKLFDATFQHRMDIGADTLSPAERSRKVFDIRQLHMDHSDRLEQLVIRALLLTTDPAIEEALNKVRAIAHNWNEPMLAAHSEDDVDQFEQLGRRLITALDDLEAATRKLTAIGANPETKSAARFQ